MAWIALMVIGVAAMIAIVMILRAPTTRTTAQLYSSPAQSIASGLLGSYLGRPPAA